MFEKEMETRQASFFYEWIGSEITIMEKEPKSKGKLSAGKNRPASWKFWL